MTRERKCHDSLPDAQEGHMFSFNYREGISLIRKCFGSKKHSTSHNLISCTHTFQEKQRGRKDVISSDFAVNEYSLYTIFLKVMLVYSNILEKIGVYTTGLVFCYSLTINMILEK